MSEVAPEAVAPNAEENQQNQSDNGDEQRGSVGGSERRDAVVRVDHDAEASSVEAEKLASGATRVDSQLISPDIPGDVQKLQTTGLKDFGVDHFHSGLKPGESFNIIPASMWFSKDKENQRGLDSILSPATHVQLARLGIRPDLKIPDESSQQAQTSDNPLEARKTEDKKKSTDASKEELKKEPDLSFNDKVLRQAMNEVLTTYCSNKKSGPKNISSEMLQRQGYGFLNDFLLTRFTQLETGFPTNFSEEIVTVATPTGSTAAADVLRQRVLQFSNETGLKFIDEAGVLHYPGLVRFLSLSDEALNVKLSQLKEHVKKEPPVLLPDVIPMNVSEQEIQSFIKKAAEQLPSGSDRLIGRLFGQFFAFFKGFSKFSKGMFDGFLGTIKENVLGSKKMFHSKERQELLDVFNQRLQKIFNNDSSKKFDSNFFLQSDSKKKTFSEQNTFFDNFFKQKHADEPVDAFVTRCVTDQELQDLYEKSTNGSDFYSSLKATFESGVSS